MVGTAPGKSGWKSLVHDPGGRETVIRYEVANVGLRPLTAKLLAC